MGILADPSRVDYPVGYSLVIPSLPEQDPLFGPGTVALGSLVAAVVCSSPAAHRWFWTSQVLMLVGRSLGWGSLFARGAPLSHSVILCAALHLSQDDLLLFPERAHFSKCGQFASISEQVLMYWEEMPGRGLETLQTGPAISAATIPKARPF